MKKIIFFSCTDHIQDRHGKSMVISGIFETILSFENVDLKVVGIGTKIPGASNYPMPSLKNILRSLIRNISSGRTIQSIIYYSVDSERKFRRFVEEEKPDIIIYDTMRTAQYSKGLKTQAKQIVYMDDLYSKRYERILEFGKKENVIINLMGNFSKKIPSIFSSLSNLSFIQALFARYEIAALKREEMNSVSLYDKIALISQVEVDDLITLTKSENVYSIRPLIKARCIRRSPQPNGRFVFLGDLKLPHNEVSIYDFLRKNITSILEKDDSIEIIIIGKGASERLMRIGEHYSKNIRILGYVEDLSIEFEKASAMIAPLVFGSGVKIKIIEAMAMGLPIIATPTALEGVYFDKDSSGVLESRIDDFMKHMLYISRPHNSVLESERIKKNFEKYYAQDKIRAEYRDVFLEGEI